MVFCKPLFQMALLVSTLVELPLGRPRLPCVRRSHREHDAELGLAAHHAGVGFAGFRERILFNHGAHAGQFGEAERVFGVGGDSSRPTLDVLPALDDLER